MNLIDAWVTEIMGEPYLSVFGKWLLKVKCHDMGGDGTSTLIFDTKEQAEQVDVGYKFLH